MSAGSERVTPGHLLEKNGARGPDVVAVKVDGKLQDLHTPVDPAATALKFTPITFMLFATISMPSFSTTLTGADLSGTQSN